ncbi:MAG: hypothetical protein ACRC1K_20865, partial [Planctomycetia bacterium]
MGKPTNDDYGTIGDDTLSTPLPPGAAAKKLGRTWARLGEATEGGLPHPDDAPFDPNATAVHEEPTHKKGAPRSPSLLARTQAGAVTPERSEPRPDAPAARPTFHPDRTEAFDDALVVAEDGLDDKTLLPTDSAVLDAATELPAGESSSIERTVTGGLVDASLQTVEGLRRLLTTLGLVTEGDWKKGAAAAADPGSVAAVLDALQRLPAEWDAGEDHFPAL